MLNPQVKESPRKGVGRLCFGTAAVSDMRKLVAKRPARKSAVKNHNLHCGRAALTGRLGARSRLGGAAALNLEAIWLILPVVICLSQRLSHACLSTYLIKVKPRTAH